MEESIIGIIPNTHSGMFGQKAYNLIVTDKRLIVAALKSAMIKEHIKKKSDESKEAGDGALKRWAKSAFSGYSYFQKYFDMKPEEILAENPENYFLDASMIKKISVKQGHIDQESNRSLPNEIKIKSTQGKYKFTFTGITVKEVKGFLSQPFGGCVK